MIKAIKLLIIAFLFTSSNYLNAQLATFNFKTITDGGTFSPKHVLAVWIEKSDGSYVKTIFLRASARKQYLYTWNSKSGGNTTDAKTGATLTSHTTHSVQWNCCDLSGMLVPAGNYKFVVEFTDKHAQGPTYSVDFIIDTATHTVTAPNQTYFTDMSVVYDPNGVGIEEYSDESGAIELFPNPAKDNIFLRLSKEMLQSGEIEIYTISGTKVYSKSVANSDMDKTIKIDISTFTQGMYIMVFRSKKQRTQAKFIIN